MNEHHFILDAIVYTSNEYNDFSRTYTVGKYEVAFEGDWEFDTYFADYMEEDDYFWSDSLTEEVIDEYFVENDTFSVIRIYCILQWEVTAGWDGDKDVEVTLTMKGIVDNHFFINGKILYSLE